MKLTKSQRKQAKEEKKRREAFDFIQWRGKQLSEALGKSIRIIDIYDVIQTKKKDTSDEYAKQAQTTTASAH